MWTLRTASLIKPEEKKHHYKRTIVVDLRYVNIPVESLLSVYPADDILILYNSIQFMEDQNIGKLK